MDPAHADLDVVVRDPGGGLLVLIMTTILSVYKPRGLIRYGKRNQYEQRKLLMP